MACIKCLYSKNLAYFPFFGKVGQQMYQTCIKVLA